MGDGPELKGGLVNTVGPRKRARVARECRATPQAIGLVRESPGRSGRPLGPLDPGPNRPRDLVDTMGPQTLARVTRDIWTTPRGHGVGRESSRTAGRPRGPLDMRPSRPGELVHTAGTRTRSQIARECWLTPRGLVPGPGRPRHLFANVGHRNRAMSHGRPGQHRGPMGSGPSRAGH